MPHKGTDPLICAAELAVALNHIVSRDIDPWTFCVVNVGALNSGTAPNVIPDTARLGFSIRTFDTEVADLADLAYRRVEEMAAGICQAYGCTYEFEWVPPYAVVENDPALVDIAFTAARKAVGEENVSETGPSTGSEDFSAFSAVVPGCFIMLNAGDEKDGLHHQNHHPDFGINEAVLAAGVRTEVQIVLDVLGGQAEGRPEDAGE